MQSDDYAHSRLSSPSRLIQLAGALIILGVLASGSSHAGQSFYKWVDDKGVTHYTQTPPKNHKAPVEKIRTDGTSVDANEAERAAQRLNQSRSQFQKDAEQRQVSKGLEAEAKEEALKKEEYCKTAKNNLKVLQENSRVREKDSSTGEYRVLGEEERQAKIAKSKKNVSAFCN